MQKTVAEILDLSILKWKLDCAADRLDSRIPDSLGDRLVRASIMMGVGGYTYTSDHAVNEAKKVLLEYESSLVTR